MPKRSLWPALTLSLTVLSIVLCLLIFPQEALRAAVRGVAIWWDVLFPALFPFFVISEMLLGFGIVHFFGTVLDPMMRPVFRIPGIGGFVMAMGFASGYPVGARLTAQLFEQRLVTREEGERLVAFTTSSDPIFLIGAVAVGFFHDASLAPVLAAAHYGAAMLVGLLMRYHGRGRSAHGSAEAAAAPGAEPLTAQPQGAPDAPPVRPRGSIWLRGLRAMHAARLLDGRPLGVLVAQAIRQSLGLIFVVGGLVVFFSVVLEVLTAAGAMRALFYGIRTLLMTTGLPDALSQAVVSGLFEVTLGAKAAGAADAAPAVGKVAIAAFVLSWAGLSVHAQVMSLLSQTNLRYAPFAVARLAHGLLAAALVLALWRPMRGAGAALSVFLPKEAVSTPYTGWLPWVIPTGAAVFAAALAALLLLYIGRALLKMMYEKVGGTR
ncbi:sporulation integral membrane protein YlbJ [Paenibacillus athensensis]|uniref:Sporulation integral membrane protein YlbJ n=1 Tax=Paenibacillus athensensis TaxID=1967502 RepID=A0A4Y8Q688_9BACL|nr:sporulation integral membrane protein YlbJ [Paenibacillus athensensis]MCD1259859.1 sporulation integral membrane protein YlbJ [Paenibacillus athensensis]